MGRAEVNIKFESPRTSVIGHFSISLLDAKRISNELQELFTTIHADLVKIFDKKLKN